MWRVVLHDVEDGASVEPDAVFAREEDFVRFENPGSELFAVDGFESGGDLYNVAP